MSKRLTVVSVCITVALILSIIGCSAPASTPTSTPTTTPTSTPAKVFNWNYPSAVTSTHPYAVILTKHFDSIAKRTNGGLNIKFVNWSETASKGNEALRVLKNNLESSCEVLHAYCVGDAPLFATADTLLLIPEMNSDPKQFYAVTDKVYSNSKVQTILTGIADRYNYVPLGLYYWGPQNFFLRKPVTKPDDFKGLQIRFPTSDGTELLKALGASPVVITAPEVYTSLQRGIFDGVVAAPQSVPAFKWTDVLSHAYIMNLTAGGTTFAVGKTAWNSLPPDYQKILSEEVQAGANEINAWLINDTATIYDTLKTKYNFTIVEASKADYQTYRNIAKEQVWPKWLEKVGPEGKTALNACLEASGASERF